MNVYITVNLPNSELDMRYFNVESLDKLVALVRQMHPDATSLLITVVL